MKLSVVIPQYNEASNLNRGVLEEVYEYLSRQAYDWEVIISDDGSTDDSFLITEEKIKSLNNFHQLKNQHGGKAHALNEGIKVASGDWILLTDMDQSTPIYEIEKLLPFTTEFKTIIGSRGSQREGQTIFRKLASIIFTGIRKSVLLNNIYDTQCGFKLFESNLLKKYFPTLDVLNQKNQKGWVVTAYDVELLHIIQRSGNAVKEVTVKWFNEDTTQGKGRKFIHESVNMLQQILKVKRNDLIGKYKK
jgi:glycosyltransferase involved in cell wall biosynthesis